MSCYECGDAQVVILNKWKAIGAKSRQAFLNAAAGKAAKSLSSNHAAWTFQPVAVQEAEEVEELEQDSLPSASPRSGETEILE